MSSASISPATFEHHNRLKQAIRRDILFLTAGIIAYAIVAYVETHAADVEIRGSFIKTFSERDARYCIADALSDSYCSDESTNEQMRSQENAAPHTGILDAGFIITSPLHRYLAQHRDVNDTLAMVNSMLLTVPLAYVIYITIWKGDFTLSFRLISTHLFRSLCGWFTYLPPDPEFLMSYYDFPEVFLCLFHQDCTSASGIPSVVPFVTFFSGHIATILIIANHLYMRRYTRLSILLHVFNWFQVIRLLATRGHYSIDLIIGYVVAVFVSSPAEKLGWYFSHSVPPSMPQNARETFEILIGVRVSGATAESNVEESDLLLQAKSQALKLDADNSVQSETSVRVALEIVSELALNRSGTK